MSSKPSNVRSVETTDTPIYCAQPSSGRPAIVCCFLLAALCTGSLIAAETVADRQAQAIQLAREGDTAAALERLRTLIAEHPEDVSLQQDLIVVRFWAGDYGGVIRAATGLHPGKVPDYVAAAMARSARNSGHLELASRWYREALATYPQSQDLYLGLAMTRSEAGAHREARDLLNALPPSTRATQRVRLASGYLHRQDRAFVPAINDYDRVLAGDPDNTEALQGKIAALKGLLLPDQALSIAYAHPGILSEAELQRLEADALAVNLRHALWAPDKRYPFPDVRQALNRIETRLQQTDPASTLGQQLRQDRIVALHAMNRWPEALAEYEALLSEGAVLPAYVQHTIGQALLSLQRPEDAEKVLRAAIAQAPQDVELNITLFYALVDQERYDEAIALIDRLVATAAPVLRARADQSGKPNPAYTNVRIVAAMARAYADQLDEAIERLEAILSEAPGNRQAMVGLAHVYRWRGWPERAEAIYREAWSPNPLENFDAEYGLAYAQLDQQDYESVRTAMRRLSPPYLTYYSFDDLHGYWSRHFRSEILFDARFGRSSGDTFGSKQYDANLWWFTYPWRLNYRAYVRTFDSWAEFQEGDHARRRLAGGVEYRKDRWRLLGELSGDRFDFDTPGGRLQADYRASDRWLFGAEADFASYATPLRADRADISSDRYSVRARYRRSEWWDLGGEVALQPFDDGNDVSSASLYGSYRLVNDYAYKLDLYGSTGLSNATLEDPVYFSPESAFALTGGVRNTWRQFRRYQHMLVHRLSADIGLYDQKGFSGAPTWTLDYELEWQLSSRLALKGGAQLNRRIYDGGDEDAWFFRFGLEGYL